MASHKKYENIKINNEINDVIKFELDLGGWKVSSFWKGDKKRLEGC